MIGQRQWLLPIAFPLADSSGAAFRAVGAGRGSATPYRPAPNGSQTAGQASRPASRQPADAPYSSPKLIPSIRAVCTMSPSIGTVRRRPIASVIFTATVSGGRSATM